MQVRRFWQNHGRLLRRLALSLAIGAVGGALFHVLHVPLAWMLGPMAFNIAASLLRMPVMVPLGLRSAMQGVIGVFLGSSFSPETAARIGDWPWSLLALTVFTVLATLAATYYYYRISGFDLMTALFSATPGGMTVMIMIGSAAGGDERRIALAQVLRIVLVVFLLPPVVIALAPGAVGAPPAVVAPPAAINIVEVFLLIGGAGLGIAIAGLLRLPAPQITGAMFASAALYLGGVVTVALPTLLLEATLWILGSSIGSRFAGAKLEELLHVGRHTLGAVAVMFTLTAGFAALLSTVLDLGFWAVLLAFSPGGVAEMCMIAVALDIDPTFVAFHHLFRIFLIMLAAPLLGKFVNRSR